MTKDEVKSQYSMLSIVERYGFQINRAGFISCPFHKGDHQASMKIYKDSYNCFGCGANGDIFTFVQNMDHCDFKTAFYSLGGTYEKPTRESQIAFYHAQKAKERRMRKEQELKKEIDLNNALFNVYVVWLKRLQPLSDAWCDCMDEYIKCLHREEELEKRREVIRLEAAQRI